MFGFLKDKLKSALGKLTKEVEKDAVVEKKEVIVEKPKEKKDDAPKKAQPAPKPIPAKPEPKKQAEAKHVPKKIEEKKEAPRYVPPAPAPVEKDPEKKKGFFQSIQNIFSKKEEVAEIKKDSEDMIGSKEELQAIAEKTDIEPVDVKSISKEDKSNSRIIKKEKIKAEPVEEIKLEPKEEKVEEAEAQEEIEEKIIEPEEELAEEEIEQEIEDEDTAEIEPEIIVEKTEEKEIPKTEIRKHVHVEPVKEKSRNKELEEQRAEKIVEQKEESKGFFSKITETFTKIQISDEKFEELFWDLEVALLENNVAVEVIDKIKRDLKKELMSGKVSRTGVEELIAATLKKSITELFDVEKIDLIDRIKQKKDKPYVVSIIGVNGSGKTTSIAKLAHKLQKEGLSVVLAASDTFRAAAIQQLEEHANRLNVKIIKHDYNSDPAAVAFDAIKYAQARNIDVVLIDTAGRLHSNTNLMRELEKVIRVCKPDIKIFVGESITGNDCVEQAKEFDNAVGIDAMILAKADIDDKGGAAISVSYILQRPILYLGTGQTYDDLKDFDANLIIEGLGL